MKNLITKKEAKKLLWLFGRHDGGALYCANFFNGEHITFSAFTLKTLRKKITEFHKHKN